MKNVTIIHSSEPRPEANEVPNLAWFNISHVLIPEIVYPSVYPFYLSPAHFAGAGWTDNQMAGFNHGSYHGSC
jgi:hypothetical protein